MQTKEAKRAYDKRISQEPWRQEQLRAAERRYRLKHPEISREYYRKNRRRCNDNTRASRDRLKERVYTHYGNGSCACIFCGISDIRVLSIDHIDDSGHIDRKVNRRCGTSLYLYLEREGFPPGYQTLCMNCQILKERARRRRLRL